MSNYQYQEYPRYLYHPKYAPEGRVFQNAEEVKGLGRGWVKTPADLPKPSKFVVWLKGTLKPWYHEWKWLLVFAGTLISGLFWVFKIYLGK